MIAAHSNQRRYRPAARQVEPVTDQRHQDRKKLHGVILPAIAAQVLLDQPDGSRKRETPEWWKRAFAAGYGIEGSTEAIPDDEFAAFVWWVEVQAAQRMGVIFPISTGATR